MRFRNGISRFGVPLGCVAAFAVVVAACAPPTVPTSVTTTTLPPPGAHTDYVLDCQALGAVQVDVAAGITVDAPATVEQGDHFTIDYVIDQTTIPSYSDPATISAVGDWLWRFPVPTNATFVGASLSGGQGYSGEATVAENMGYIEFAIPGSALATVTVDHPVISVELTASGPSGVDIESSIAGTSYAEPGMSFTSATNFGSIGTVCFPYAPAPVFSTTQIVGGDPEPATGCYPGSGDWLYGTGTPSYSYEGPINVVGNTSLWANVDGTCVTGGAVPVTSVYGPDAADADAKCFDLYGTEAIDYQPMGAEFFICALP